MNPTILRLVGPGFLNQVPTLSSLLSALATLSAELALPACCCDAFFA